jgi:hypothetical protein
MIERFTPEWASVESYRHWKGWYRFETGEADHLAERAYEAVGGYPLRKFLNRLGKKGKAKDELIARWLKKEE